MADTSADFTGTFQELAQVRMCLYIQLFTENDVGGRPTL